MSKYKVHELKTWPYFFNQILIGVKRYEIREDDRGFKVGDELMLNEWDPETEEYTGRAVDAVITSKVDGGQLGIKDGYCVLGIRTI